MGQGTRRMEQEIHVGVDVVERRRRPLLGSHRRLDCTVHPWNRAYSVPMGACHLRSNISSADRGRRNEVNVTGPDGKVMFCVDMDGWEE